MAVQLHSHIKSVQEQGNNHNYSAKPLTETLTNGFFTVDQKWNVKHWNKAAEKLLGVQAKDIIGKNLWEEFAGTIPLDFYSAYHKAFLQDIPLHFEEYWGEMGAWFDVVTYHCDDTLSVSFKSSNYPHSGYPDNPVQRLKVLTELYKFVSEITNDALWEWDLQAREMFWIDGGHKRIFGYQIENALIPQSFWESCLHPDDKAGILTRLNKIIIEGSTCLWEDEYRFKKANGEYAFVHDRGHIIYDGDQKASRMIGATQDISENVLLENKLVHERVASQREIIEAAMIAQEKERADIGMELHDNLNQILAVVKLYIHLANTSEDKREMYLEKSSDYIMDVMKEIRKISKNLSAPGTNFIGLFDSIRSLLDDLVIIHPIKFKFHNDSINEEDLNEKLQLTVFRIVQEQVNNILKHSKATHATIHISRQDNQIILLISDNGDGCDILKILEEKKGVGIINIKSRTEFFGGSTTIVSKPGKGYKLKVILPLNGPV